MKNKRAPALFLWLFRLAGIFPIFLFCSCALYSSGGANGSAPILVTQCTVPSDQSGTISGHWAVTPIPIAFHQGEFSSDETQAITAAVDTWNQFYKASKNISTLDYGGDPTNPKTSAISDPSQSGALCANGLIQSGKFNGDVVIYKLGQWPKSYPPNAMALTSFCTTAFPGDPYPHMYMAVMEINYQFFFASGTKVPDLQSIILHEFGHLHGLNHSCEGTAKTGTPSCNDPALNPDYLSASMFPVFTFDDTGAGQVKRALGTNDEERANCLYQAAQ